MTDIDERNLRILRESTRDWLYQLHNQQLMTPILDIGPMTPIGIFERMPDTYIDARTLDWDYRSIDIDSSAEPDIVGDFITDPNLVATESIGTALMFSCLEHIPNLFDVPKALCRIMKPYGKVYIIVPWNIRFHGPRPDCWRISDDGLHALFDSCFSVKVEQIPDPERSLSPVGLKATLTKIYHMEYNPK